MYGRVLNRTISWLGMLQVWAKISHLLWHALDQKDWITTGSRCAVTERLRNAYICVLEEKEDILIILFW